MATVRESIVRELRAAADGRVASSRTLSMALELLEVLWAELRLLNEEQQRLHRAIGAEAVHPQPGK